MALDLCISVVIYGNEAQEVQNLIDSCASSKLNWRLVFVDNAPGETAFNFEDCPESVEYIASPKNLGYGNAHNLVILNPKYEAKYHLIANPDIRFEAKILEQLLAKMDQEDDLSLIMPKVIWPNGKDQGLRKLLPKPSDLFLRRFLPSSLGALVRGQKEAYEMLNFDANKALQVPVLSGCFMFCRGESLRAIGGFDPRFFLYLEDVDLSRRLNEKGKNLYWPEVEVIHEYQKSSYRSWRPLFLHLRSAWQYFNKHGWFFDPQRKVINKAALEQKQSDA